MMYCPKCGRIMAPVYHDGRLVLHKCFKCRATDFELFLDRVAKAQKKRPLRGGQIRFDKVT